MSQSWVTEAGLSGTMLPVIYGPLVIERRTRQILQTRLDKIRPHGSFLEATLSCVASPCIRTVIVEHKLRSLRQITSGRSQVAVRSYNKIALSYSLLTNNASSLRCLRITCSHIPSSPLPLRDYMHLAQRWTRRTRLMHHMMTDAPVSSAKFTDLVTLGFAVAFSWKPVGV